MASPGEDERSVLRGQPLVLRLAHLLVRCEVPAGDMPLAAVVGVPNYDGLVVDGIDAVPKLT